MTKNFSIFENKTEGMPSVDERSVRSMLDMTETVNKAPPPGYEKLPRDVQNVVRPRRGHDY